MSYKAELSRLVKHIRSARRAQKREALHTDRLRAHIKKLASQYNALSRSTRHQPMAGK